MCGLGKPWFDLGLDRSLAGATDQLTALGANGWIVVVGAVVAVAIAAMAIAVIAGLVTLLTWRRPPRGVDPTLGFELDGIDHARGRLALARSASGRELHRREKLVRRVLAGTPIAEASDRSGVAERTARQWLGLYCDSGGPRRKKGPGPFFRRQQQPPSREA